MSSNGVYVKKRIGNTEVIFKENEIRYGQRTYVITEGNIETE